MSDVYREPENSTVDDWFGQSVERDAELADELVAEDPAAAEDRFDREATGAQEQAERRAPHVADMDPSKPRPTPAQAEENAELDPPA